MLKKKEENFLHIFFKKSQKTYILHKKVIKSFEHLSKCKFLIIFEHTCSEKSKKISQFEKNLFELFRNLKKTVTSFSYTFNN